METQQLYLIIGVSAVVAIISSLLTASITGDVISVAKGTAGKVYNTTEVNTLFNNYKAKSCNGDKICEVFSVSTAAGSRKDLDITSDTKRINVIASDVNVKGNIYADGLMSSAFMQTQSLQAQSIYADGLGVGSTNLTDGAMQTTRSFLMQSTGSLVIQATPSEYDGGIYDPYWNYSNDPYWNYSDNPIENKSAESIIKLVTDELDVNIGGDGSSVPDMRIMGAYKGLRIEGNAIYGIDMTRGDFSGLVYVPNLESNNMKVLTLFGQGNAYVCVDGKGNLFRSLSPCR